MACSNGSVLLLQEGKHAVQGHEGEGRTRSTWFPVYPVHRRMGLPLMLIAERTRQMEIPPGALTVEVSLTRHGEEAYN